MVPPLAAVALQNAIMFGVYNNAIRLFPKAQDHLHSALQVAFAGGLAGLAQLWIITPTDLVKIKLQMQTECKCYTCLNGCLNYKTKAGFLFGELAYTWNSSASFQMSSTPHLSQMDLPGVRSCPIDRWRKTYKLQTLRAAFCPYNMCVGQLYTCVLPRSKKE